jgi:kynureninase
MMGPLRDRSVELTRSLEMLLKQSQYFVPANEVWKNMRRGFTIITPSETSQREAQLSLLFLPTGSDVMRTVFEYLMKNGVISGDEMEPDVIRLAPTPLYNTLKDCEQAVAVLEKAFNVMV